MTSHSLNTQTANQRPSKGTIMVHPGPRDAFASQKCLFTLEFLHHRPGLTHGPLPHRYRILIFKNARRRTCQICNHICSIHFREWAGVGFQCPDSCMDFCATCCAFLAWILQNSFPGELEIACLAKSKNMKTYYSTL